MKKSTLFLLFFITSFLYAQNIDIELIANGFNSPVSIKATTDSKLFIVERNGVIKILNGNGTVNGTPFLDITEKVSDSGGERGLLGLAFHPNYVTNGYFYVNYINDSGNTVIARYTRTNETTANVDSELILLRINQPDTNHNGGDMNFGPDGYLYIASGDGGGSGDPSNYAQSLNTLLGKLLRIDVDNTSNGNNYAIPSNNPYLNDGDSNTLPEIWAYGLRNPWKFSFDKTTGDLWIADVGQGVYEEINMVLSATSALNYGWRCYEGANHPYNTDNCPSESATTRPIAEYSHNGNGVFKCSITGGFRYRGTLYPNFTGLYFFADFCSDEIGVLTPNGSNWTMTFPKQYSNKGWTTFGEGNDGELYIAGIESGEVFKIVDTSLSIENVNQLNISIYPNPTDNLINFNVSLLKNPLKFIKISDIHGKLIKQTTSINSPLTTLSVNNLANGIYFIEFLDISGVKEIKKLIKY
ncbi:putative secreted protein (Por secretion system target) [Mariniflexile fucanivorans]|uniref:Putative secreted protein (Por secretion system target) n=1 Tax=Mariniflexile fucanivorans TaxID=264023 RepID=A0A4R1RDJ4_9FLAO|nr:PQQ-dependent sugar dehydrogenase [Mariniflexile fucanivorans]TCL63938.1 putative secreted protein (Por secretion system target) [Mariniflexile fucanivorans]